MAKHYRSNHDKLNCKIRICENATVRRFIILFSVTFLLFLPSIFFHVKNTEFFQKYGYKDTTAKDNMQMENTKRLRSAEQYFDMLEKTKLHDMLRHTGSSNHTIALTIITVSRNRHAIDAYEPKYLTQVVWQFISQLHAAKAEGFAHEIHLAICNVDRDPNSYPEAKALSRFVPTFERFDKTHFSLVHPLEKEKEDYVFCLNRSLASNPSHVLLVEDDALPRDDFFAVLSQTLSNYVENHWHHGEIVPRSENLAYVKFYHPERLLGFISLDSERLPDLFALTAFIGTILTLIHHVAFLRDKVNTHTIWTVFLIYTAVVMLSVGRANINQWRKLFSPFFHTYTNAPSCCTPAMLFPRAGAVKVVEFLNAVRCGNNFGKDSALDQMLPKLRMSAYLVQPNTFTHIGQYSSLRERLVDPFMVD